MGPQEAVERALSLSRADGCVVIAEESANANLRWAGNTLTTNGVSNTSRLTVVALRGTADGVAAGVVSRTAVGADGLEDLVRAAEADAAGNEPAEDAAPLVGASGAPGAGSGAAWDDDPAETGIGVFGAFAPALGEAFGEAASRGGKLYGFANHTVTSTFVGTSEGLRARYDQPTGLVELNAKRGGGSAWSGAATRDFADVDAAALAGGLARRLDWSERRVELPAGRYETILPPSAVADLMIYLYWSAGARDAHDGRTVFSAPGGGTRVGDKLASLPVTLSSDPGAAGLECAPFVVARLSDRESSVFDNGLGLGRTEWISGGTLAALTQTRHSAAMTGLPVTPAIDNLTLAGPSGGAGGASLEDMVARTGRGLLLTCLWYIREVDSQRLLLTGLTRDGVYLVEDGEVVGAVNNFRFNESPVDLLSRLAEVGGTVPTLPREWSDYFTRTAMPAVRVPDFNMSTVSKAS
ncbi:MULTISPECIES: metallopeptidase TldD-related protein [Actinomadura]|uniref:Metallopeptidase TldD-related protein n=1 Tax=Actinomadura yumaensis TaxID=111807 RepID=A0ABW2CUI3_9ACTN|nr:metallopeptidase TldD-related protein [Actinomadura sp. J1-007]MWK39262.1 TldD/PmbA family protein [Actinomadura sp. J1-007]